MSVARFAVRTSVTADRSVGHKYKFLTEECRTWH